ncbi:YncE family protein, partial [Nevskia soli]|uniref:YncE family protein n=1 Tax=Nevskia soli TaxID=418856 RepID=UPI0015D84C29
MPIRTLCASVILATAACGDVRAAAHVFASLTSGAVSISHINSATGRQSLVYPTIPGVRYLAVSPGGGQALFLADSSSLAGFVNLTTGALSPSIALTGTPAAAFFSQDGLTAFVIGSDLDQSGGGDTYTLHLFAIDVTTQAVSIDLKYPSLAGLQPCCNQSAGFAVSPDGTKLYLPTSTAAADVIAIFSLPSLTLSQTVTVGTSSNIFYPTTVAATSDGEYLVIGGSNQDDAPILALYSANTYQELTSVAVPDPNEAQIENLVASPTSGAVYAVVRVETTGDYVTTISTPSLNLSAPLALTADDSFEDMAVSPDGTKLLVGASILDLSSQTFQALNSLSTLGVQGEFSDAGDLWIVNEDSTQIAVLEEGNSVVSSLISVGFQGAICPGPPGTIYFLPLGVAL